MPKELTKRQYRDALMKAREDIALLLATNVETQQHLHALIGITGDLYEAVLQEEAPEFEFRLKAVS